MVNILPQGAQRSLYQKYYFRLAAAFFFTAGVFVAVGAALLAPSYLLAEEEAASAKRFRDAVVETLALKGTNTAARTVSALAEEVKLLNAYGKKETAIPIIAGALSAQDSAIALRKIAFSWRDQNGGAVTLDGVADTRTALVEYVSELQKNALFSGVAVPVSNLASDADIAFTLTFDFKAP